MGEGDVVPGKPDSVANGNVEGESEASVGEKPVDTGDEKGEQNNGATAMEEDMSENAKVDTQDMDEDKDDVKEGKIIEAKLEDENFAEEGKNNEGKDETEVEDVKEETPEGGEKDEGEDVKMGEVSGEEAKKETLDKAEEDVDDVKEEEQPEESKEAKGTKKRPRSKSNTAKKDKNKKSKPEEKKEKEPKTPTEKKTKVSKVSVEKKEKEPKTPALPTIDRPVRERKSVERLVATIEKDSGREFHIEKGRGTALKDIPNVAYKLSRKKTEDTFKLLHTILFGRRGKAAQVKSNISRFSGFVWHDNEEKQMVKVKEKLDKCVKEKLVEFCDVLDLPISKANTRKEDIVAKLIEFLMEPCATTSELLSEKDQSSKGKKRKRTPKPASGGDTSSKASAQVRDNPFLHSPEAIATMSAVRPKKTDSASKKGGKTKSTPSESEDETDEEKERVHEEEDANGVPDISEDEVSDQAESGDKKSESEDESDEDKGKKQGSTKSSVKKESAKKESAEKSEEDSDEDKGKKKQGSRKSSAKKESTEKAKSKKVTVSQKATPPTKKTPSKSPPSLSRTSDMSTKKSSGKTSDVSLKRSSSKNKDESTKKPSASKKSSSKKKDDSASKNTGKKVLKVKDKPKEAKLSPSDDDLKTAICEILKEVDFNTATFTDILKILAKRFNMDLTPKKSMIKLMIQDELTKLADADDADDEDEADAENDEKKPSTQGVKA